MSREINTSASLTVNKGNLVESRSVNGAFDLNAAAPAKAAGIASIGFSAHEAIAMGDVAAAGWALFKNLDAANFVEIGVDVSAAFHAFVKLMPGEFALLRLATNAPYAKADTAAILLSYEIYDD